MRWLPLSLMIILVTTACRGPERPSLPAPEVACTNIVTWHGLVPGQSTQQDVIKVLGHPVQTGSRQTIYGSFSYYAYPIEPGSVVARFRQDRVFFWGDGVIAWIEVTRADRDGKFHTAGEIIDRLGKTLDVAYKNTSGPGSGPIDVQVGPDFLFVWSDCGMALDLIGPCWVFKPGSPSCPADNSSANPTPQIANDLTFRHPNPNPALPIEFIGVPEDNIILMEFLFAPTRYQGFVDNYILKIPHGLWGDYLYEVRPK